MLLGLGKGKRANCSVKIMTLLADVVPAAFSVTALARNRRRCESGSAKGDDNRRPSRKRPYPKQSAPYAPAPTGTGGPDVAPPSACCGAPDEEP